MSSRNKSSQMRTVRNILTNLMSLQDVHCASQFMRVLVLTNLILITLYLRVHLQASAPDTQRRPIRTHDAEPTNCSPCAPKPAPRAISNEDLDYPYATNPDQQDVTIYISSWTEVQPNNYQWMRTGTKEFDECDNLASWMKCHYTPQPSEEQLRRSHAVLFHARHIIQEKGLPPRDPSQKWVFFETEAPTNVWNYVDPSWDYWDKFNLTATFTKDSDISNDHHDMVCEPRPQWRPSGVNHAATKPKQVAWFVSHCNTSSRRELYVEELKKYIQVDIFGNCGNKSVCQASRPDKCSLELINSTYKFYLSFENAFCQDYVSEKLHDAIKANVIPVVLGEADYANILPKGTYINIRDYPSPKELARYLKHIDQRHRVFNTYIETKNAYDCRVHYNAAKRFPCKLCQYLHLHRHKQQTLYDAASFWSVQRRCTSPLDFYRGVADEIIPRIKFTDIPKVFL